MRGISHLLLLFIAIDLCRADTNFSISEIISNVIRNCQVSAVVFLSDDVDETEHFAFGLKSKILTAITKSSDSILFTHYDQLNKTNDKDIYEIIRRVTGPTLFVMMTHKAEKVIALAENYFDIEGRRRGSVLIHCSKWLIFNQQQDQVEKILYSASDNIAILELDREWFISHAKTLIWRENNTRETDVINMSGLIDKPSTCHIFPNIRNNLNGRRLNILTKAAGDFTITIRNNSRTGMPGYHGFLIDIINALSRHLNFTYTLSPKPSHDDQVSWDQYLSSVASGEFDIGLGLLSTTLNPLFNLTIMNPILSDSITGLALYENIKEDFHFTFLCPFDPVILVMLLCSYVLTTVIYVFIVGVVYSDKAVESTAIFKQDNKSSYPLMQTMPQYLRRNAWTLSAAIVNQAYLPRPRQMSARLLLFLWSLCLIMFYALFIGNITAAMVAKKDGVPFRSFQEMLDKGNYRWGTINKSYPDILLKSSNNGIMKHLYQQIENFPPSANNEYETLMEKIKSLEKGYVIIHSETLLRHMQNQLESPDDYFIVKEPLLRSSYGLAFQKDSDLGEIFSEQIQIMFNTGLVAMLHNLYKGKEYPENGRNEEQRVVTVNDVLAPFVVIGALLVMACCVLFWERFMSHKGRDSPRS